jgi:hypothetical protein
MKVTDGTSCDQLARHIIENIHKQLTVGKIDRNNCVAIITAAVKLANKMPRLNGHQRKQCVMIAIDILAKGDEKNDLVSEGAMRELRLLVENKLVSNVIEAVIQAAKGKYGTFSRWFSLGSCLPTCCL